jgi:hypothetical protein
LLLLLNSGQVRRRHTSRRRSLNLSHRSGIRASEGGRRRRRGRFMGKWSEVR